MDVNERLAATCESDVLVEFTCLVSVMGSCQSMVRME